jgi:hypothetical protein
VLLPEVALPSKAQVKRLIAQGLDFSGIGRRLGVPRSQAYRTGSPGG